jgi:uncharacterized protein (TIGR02391 family)
MKVSPKTNLNGARRKLAAMKQRGETMLAEKKINETVLDTWSASCAKCVEEAFGEGSDHVHQFQETPFLAWVAGEAPDPRKEERERRKKLQQRLTVLNELIAQLDMEETFEAGDAPALGPNDSFWSLLHQRVVKTAKARFEAGHYADSVEAALKELNSVVKALVKKATGKELDGADLMHQALSPKNPIIILDDLGTESGRSQQTGYMGIFAGSMTGIRNPKAHENLTITKERAIHHLFLASLLFNRLDERTNLR